MSHDSDRTEPPVTNEELYVELNKVYRLLMLATAGVIASLGYFASTAGYANTGLFLTVCGTLLFVASVAIKSRNGLTSLSEWLIRDDIETIEDLEERLTGAARTDGSGGDRDE